MKKYIWTLFLVISFIVCSLLYLKYDKQGYHYGLRCRFYDKKMPYNLKPHDGSQFSFTLKDEDDFELVGRGFKYETTDFIINNFKSYGYNVTSFIVICTDSINTTKYLISYETGYKSINGNPEISFKDLGKKDFNKLKHKYKWFEVSKEKYYKIESNKFLSLVGALFTLLFIVLRLFNPSCLNRSV